jgi:hypothetical protein
MPVGAATGAATATELRALVHQLSNAVQRAFGTGELLDEQARELRAPVELRETVTAVLDHLDDVGRFVRELQFVVAEIAGPRQAGGGEAR